MRADLLRYGPGRTSRPPVPTVAFVAGALLLVWSGYIHFHLWDSVGYRHIATIGPLFLLQSISAVVIGLVVIAARQVWAAVVGIGFALSTMVGFLLAVSLPKGIFGFPDSWASPFARQAFFIESAAIVVLAVAGALCLAGSASATRVGPTPAGSPSPGA